MMMATDDVTASEAIRSGRAPDARTRKERDARPHKEQEARLRGEQGARRRKERSSQPADPWENWKPEFHAQGSPHARQEAAHPTESVSLRLTGERQEERCQRRIVDARLWEAMSAHQQQAAMTIALSFETMGKGLGFAASDWQRVPGARGAANIAESHGRLINAYIEWTKACHRENISHSMVVDVLVFGFSCKMIDRDRRVRAGTTRRNLMDGLALYCRLRGWPA